MASTFPNLRRQEEEEVEVNAYSPPVEAFILVGDKEEQKALIICEDDLILLTRNNHNNTMGDYDCTGGGVPYRRSHCMNKFQWVVLFVYIGIVWPLGVYCFPRFIRATSSDFQPFRGTPSYDADQLYKEAYHIVGEEHLPVLVVLEQQINTTTNNNETTTLVDGISSCYKETREFVLNLTAHLQDTFAPFTKVSNFYLAEQAGLYTFARRHFASHNGRMTFIRIEFSTSEKQRFLEELETFINLHPSPWFHVSLTGVHYFQQDMLHGIRSDLKTMDFISLPLSLLVVAFVLIGNHTTSVKKLLSIVLIPLFTILSTAALAGLIMYPVAEYITQVTQFTPSLMMSLIIAMSIDYSLFLLSRYIEDFVKLQDKSVTIADMIQYSGHTIITSGVTLCCSFLGLFLLPLPMLQSVGGGAIVSILSALVVNLTLLPALLHTRLGDWMVESEECLTNTIVKSGAELDAPASETPLLDSIDEAIQDEQTSVYDGIDLDDAKMKQSLWYKLGTVLLNPYKGVFILMLILGAIAPVAYFFPQCGSSISFDLMVPVGSPSKQAFNRLGNEFGFGTLSPYKILFDGRPSKTGVGSAKFFDRINLVLHELTGEEFPATPDLNSFTGITTLNGQNISHRFYEASLICGKTCFFEQMRTIAAIDHVMTSTNGLTTYVNVQLNVDPFSDKGIQWLIQARKKIQTIVSTEGGDSFLKVVIAGSASIEYDVVKSVHQHFPTMILITFLLVMALMGTFFRSIVVPLRSVLSISLTEAFAFGLAVLVYQNGILDGVFYTGSISWLPPIFSFSVIMGLSLDYDVFLVSRILEFRLKGLDHKSSVLAGLYKTGSIITAAGIIMAVAFVGLLGSKTIILNQTAFLLTIAVLVDTFVVRIFVVPILMGLTGNLSWWPRRLST